MRSLRSWLYPVPVLLVLLAGGIAADPAFLEAQYFGRNQVQYETFDFRVLRTEHFDVYYYPQEETAARDAARMAERWYDRFSELLDYELSSRQPLVLYGSQPAAQQTTVIGGGIDPGTGGVTESAKQRIVMPLTGSYQETDHVLGHELVHAFQYDISGLGRSGGNVGAGGRQLGTAPLWFTEGMAEYLSGGPVDPNAAMVVRDGALTGDIPSIEELPRFFPYTWGHSFWAYVAGRWGDAVIGQILKQVGEGVPYPQAFQQLLNTSLDEIGEDWATAIRRAYLPLLAERPEAREIAEPLITDTGEGGSANLGPSVSPNGEYVAFLSSLGGLDIEVFLANAETGEVIRRLVEGAAFDPHFQSLRFINSAGTWSPDGERFAFGALRGASDVIVVLDVQSADIAREIRIPGVREITTPTWSPDGRTIVFAGVEGGMSDLYAHDLQTGETRRLTDDVFANLHPNFSPDGTRIAFATDRGPDTEPSVLDFDGYRIAVLDLATGQVEILPQTQTGEANNINPVWTPEGDGLYFVSDRTGIPNIYRLELTTGDLFRITDLFGGVSGITDISPAISAARDADRLLFTAYEENGYNIYALTTPEELTGTRVEAAELAEGDRLPALLPPVPRPDEPVYNRVAAYLDNPAAGLPSPAAVAAAEVVDYGPSLSLDYLAQPQVGYATGGAFGQGGLYGGISAVFSDMLGYHTVFGTLQAQGQLDEIGFSTVYLNRKQRWNWGGLAQRIPYISLGQGFECVTEDGTSTSCPTTGEALANYQIFRQRIFNSNLAALAQYPLSQSQRVEVSGGYRRIAQSVQVTEVPGIALIQNGRVLGFQQIANPEQDEAEEFGFAYNLGEASAALVYDNSLFGFTSPFAGQRYRIEITPTFGDLQFVQGLADYRRYLWFQPFTLAVQGLHFGRYGQDSDGFFYPLFLGQPSFVRGYWNVYSECRGNAGACERDVLGQLFGSRIGVAKAELRFPLIRQLVIGPIPFPPIEGFGFFDAGVAWDKSTSPVLERGTQLNPEDRGILTSTGVGARINLFGYAIAEINYVNALDRDEGWHWQFALQPGF